MKLPEAVSILRQCRGARIGAIGSGSGLDWVVLRESTVGQPAGVSMKNLPIGSTITPASHPEWGAFVVESIDNDLYTLRGPTGARTLSVAQAAKFWTVVITDVAQVASVRDLHRFLEWNDFATTAPAADDHCHPYAWPPLSPDGEVDDQARTLARDLQQRGWLGPFERDDEGAPCYRITYAPAPAPSQAADAPNP